MGKVEERFRQQRLAKHAPVKPPHRVSWGRNPVAFDFREVSIHERMTGTPPAPELKGRLEGNCNREHCQAPGATWWNTSTRAYYCERCARDINAACRQLKEPLILFPSAGTEADVAMRYGEQR